MHCVTVVVRESNCVALIFWAVGTPWTSHSLYISSPSSMIQNPYSPRMGTPSAVSTSKIVWVPINSPTGISRAKGLQYLGMGLDCAGARSEKAKKTTIRPKHYPEKTQERVFGPSWFHRAWFADCDANRWQPSAYHIWFLLTRVCAFQRMLQQGLRSKHDKKMDPGII